MTTPAAPLDAGLNLAALAPILRSSPQYAALAEALGAGDSASAAPAVRLARARAQTSPESVPFLISALADDLGAPALIIAPKPEEARRLHESLCAWVADPSRVHHFPETETLPFERLATDARAAQTRVGVLRALSQADGANPPIVVASALSIAQRTLDRDSFDFARQTVGVGDVLEVDDALDNWRRMGYAFGSAVYAPGTVSRRGGIIDIFPVGAEYPARIELWGNDVDSLRTFDPATQRSIEMIDSIEIIPANETLPAMTDREDLDDQLARVDDSNCDEANRGRVREEISLLLDGHEVEDLNMYAGFFNRGTLADYAPPNALSIVLRPDEAEAAARENEERVRTLRDAKERRGELPRGFPSFHADWDEIAAAVSAFGRRLDILRWGATDLIYDDVRVMPFEAAPAFGGDLDDFAADARTAAEDGDCVVAITSHSRRLDEILSESGTRAEQMDALRACPRAGSLALLQAAGPSFGDGFALSAPDRRLIVLGDAEIFGVAKRRRTARRTRANWDAFLSEISPGDYVVHVEHGVGRFVGVGRPSELSANGESASAEYLTIEYANRDRLYIPLEHLDRVTPYVAPGDVSPNLTRLGTQEWSRAKARAERSTREMAAELISLYAARELQSGHPFGDDTNWQRELEESFPFEETPDQLTTLAEVKADMESERPMDRLVCGDVGYGKTEIALRAAFKAVMGGKQVAVLVPTTVLAQQHYTTFSERLSAYPVRVEMLSRFRTNAEQREVVAALAKGEVDVCIGTHRLIQKDVRFKDLGLAIVDEEQRFGVAHKERLKRMRQEVDTLTLTATPIPRTLHMSLAGARDMSAIETPPEERLPIKTYVSEFSDELVREAILRELDRQGQIYFLHNRVYNIAYFANYIRRIAPEAKVGIAHGQMGEGELEQAMSAFEAGEFDVLVCTTIIESGLDIPNVNTLIVNRADSFGLAQLYQLRGRVGRGSRRAYAYLLIPQARALSETAQRRLDAMLAATELGAGFRIAMKDLEIRGAGNLLGAEQSGHINAIGFELYTRLLSHAVEDLRARREAGEFMGMSADETARAARKGAGESVSDALAPEPSVGVDLGVPAGLPSAYVPDLRARMGIYQRLIKLEDAAEIDPLEDELRDRFGPLPWQARGLLYTVKLRIAAKRAGVSAIVREGDKIILRLSTEAGGARRALQRRLPQAAEAGNTQIRLDLSKLQTGWEEPLAETVERLAEFRGETLRRAAEAGG